MSDEQAEKVGHKLAAMQGFNWLPGMLDGRCQNVLVDVKTTNGTDNAWLWFNGHFPIRSWDTKEYWPDMRHESTWRLVGSQLSDEDAEPRFVRAGQDNEEPLWYAVEGDGHGPCWPLLIEWASE